MIGTTEPAGVKPRTVWMIVALLVAAACVACWCALPLIWDGGYQLCVTLISQKAYYYLTRFHSGILWQPVVELSRVTDNRTALLFAYGLPFLLAPAVNVAASWWFVRKTAPRLVFWAVCGVAVSLPGQAFVINDSVLQHSLAWPVFLGAMVRLTWPQRALWLALAVFQFSHQIGALVLLCTAAAAWFAGSRAKFAVCAALLALAVAKIVWISNPAWAGVYFDSYAAQEASLSSAVTAFATGVFGLPLLGLVLLWLAAARMERSDDAAKLWKLALAGLSAWVAWSLVPMFWASAINYRRWIIPLAIPFFYLAVMDARRAALPRLPELRDRIALGIGVVFFLVLAAQSVTWRMQLNALMADIEKAPSPVVMAKDLPSAQSWQVNHWGITTTVMFLQGKKPARYLAYEEESRAAILAEKPSVPLWKPHLVPLEPGATGWFDHRGIRSARSD